MISKANPLTALWRYEIVERNSLICHLAKFSQVIAEMERSAEEHRSGEKSTSTAATVLQDGNDSGTAENFPRGGTAVASSACQKDDLPKPSGMAVVKGRKRYNRSKKAAEEALQKALEYMNSSSDTRSETDGLVKHQTSSHPREALRLASEALKEQGAMSCKEAKQKIPPAKGPMVMTPLPPKVSEPMCVLESRPKKIVKGAPYALQGAPVKRSDMSPLEATTGMLRSTDEAVRDYAALRLDASVAEVASALVAILETETSADVLRSALTNLAQHVVHSASVAATKLLQHADAGVRLDAARLVGSVLQHDGARLQLSRCAASDPDLHVRTEATVGLLAFDEETEEHVEIMHHEQPAERPHTPETDDTIHDKVGLSANIAMADPKDDVPPISDDLLDRLLDLPFDSGDPRRVLDAFESLNNRVLRGTARDKTVTSRAAIATTAFDSKRRVIPKIYDDGDDNQGKATAAQKDRLARPPDRKIRHLRDTASRRFDVGNSGHQSREQHSMLQTAAVYKAANVRACFTDPRTCEGDKNKVRRRTATRQQNLPCTEGDPMAPHASLPPERPISAEAGCAVEDHLPLSLTLSSSLPAITA